MSTHKKIYIQPCSLNYNSFFTITRIRTNHICDCKYEFYYVIINYFRAEAGKGAMTFGKKKNVVCKLDKI